MSWNELCRRLRARGICIGRLEGGRWYVEPRPHGDLEAAIGEHREQLLALLGDRTLALAMKTLGAEVVGIGLWEETLLAVPFPPRSPNGHELHAHGGRLVEWRMVGGQPLCCPCHPAGMTLGATMTTILRPGEA